jgi:nucleoside-diphosphate-sugar epimerase
MAVKILVTGSTGFIGSHLVEELLIYNIHCFVRPASSKGGFSNKYYECLQCIHCGTI